MLHVCVHVPRTSTTAGAAYQATAAHPPQELLVLGSQPLCALRDAVCCLSDVNAAETEAYVSGARVLPLKVWQGCWSAAGRAAAAAAAGGWLLGLLPLPAWQDSCCWWCCCCGDDWGNGCRRRLEARGGWWPGQKYGGDWAVTQVL